MAEPTDAEEGRVEIILRGERLALYELLDRFPGQLRVDDLIRRVTRFEEVPSFGDTENLKESIAELVGFGLVVRHGPMVLPTPAALHIDLLLEGQDWRR
jgi:hypothetical protein